MAAFDKVVARSVEDCASGCIVWTGGASNAHGMIEGRPVHRIVWEEVRGALDDRVLHHRCETTLCVNVDHLEPMSRGEHTRLHHRERRVYDEFGTWYVR